MDELIRFVEFRGGLNRLISSSKFVESDYGYSSNIRRISRGISANIFINIYYKMRAFILLLLLPPIYTVVRQVLLCWNGRFREVGRAGRGHVLLSRECSERTKLATSPVSYFSLN